MIKLNDIMKIIEGGGYFGLRGLSGIYGDAEYTEGEILDCTIDDWDSREVRYKPDLPKLPGTSAIQIHDFMTADEITDKYKQALRYSDCNKVILITGDRMTYGADQDEIIISYIGDGAKFLGYVDIKI